MSTFVNIFAAKAPDAAGKSRAARYCLHLVKERPPLPAAAIVAALGKSTVNGLHTTYQADALNTGGARATAEYRNFLSQLHAAEPDRVAGYHAEVLDRLTPEARATLETHGVGALFMATGDHASTSLNGEEISGKSRATINMEKDRISNILNDAPGRFDIADNLEADSAGPFWEVPSLGNEAVGRYGNIIDKEAKRQGVDPDLVKAVLYMEHARGHWGGLNYLSDTLGISDTKLPMNIDPEIWRKLGLSPDTATDPQQNIRSSVTLLKRISDRIDTPTPEKIGSIWNFTGREKVSDIGAYVGRIYQEKPWDR